MKLLRAEHIVPGDTLHLEHDHLCDADVVGRETVVLDGESRVRLTLSTGALLTLCEATTVWATTLDEHVARVLCGGAPVEPLVPFLPTDPDGATVVVRGADEVHSSLYGEWAGS